MSTTSRRPPPRALHLVLNSTSVPSSPLSTTTNGLKSATSSGSTKEGQAASPLTRNNTPRRQSSISYNTSSSKPRSPGLVRRNSTGKHIESNTVGIKRQTAEDCAPQTSPPVVQETEPVTLAERHADLLRFIAQKESKCLELRTQLAQHEAELLLLKRKWERIVSKGLPSSSRLDAPLYTAVDMLGDIREGVQHGLEKVLAVLEPNALGTLSQSSTSECVSPINAPADSSSSSSKRTSTSISSSASTCGRSSLTNSRSSASSLYCDISSINAQLLDSPSQDDDEAICLSNGSKDLSSVTTPLRTSSPTVKSPTLGGADDASGKKRRSKPLSMSLSQFSPILPNVEALTPLSKQVANWVSPAMNKKWEELRANETLSKRSKRATLLFNDMLAVLTPSATEPTRTPSSTENNPPSSRTSSALHSIENASFPGVATLSIDASSSKANVSPSISLLDDDDDDDIGSGVVMQPDIMPASDVRPQDDDHAKTEDESDEEWNW